MKNDISNNMGCHLKAFAFLVVGVALGLNGVLALGASEARTPISSNATPPDQSAVPIMNSLIADLTARVDRQAQTADLEAQIQNLIRSGNEAYKAGNFKAAESDFRKAQQTILDGPEAVFYESPIRALFFELHQRLDPHNGRPALSELMLAALSPEVENQVRTLKKYYSRQGRPTSAIGQQRLKQYEPMMKKIFQAEGVPSELIYVGLIESAYNPYARSPAGARGIWQFVPDTGRRYGLKQHGPVDDRQDPERSTRAAAQYLHDLYDLFGDWPLALAAYNAGEYRPLHVIQKTGIRDFWEMRRRGLLPLETRNYVPAVLAAIRSGERVQPISLSEKSALPWVATVNHR
ncbi:MAG: lytic transglycosylase domain-containing protein [Acidobacteriia bacterium]|nr:lytic transglycosylase domain-containing protein [Terriglobia bacterium]